ncbi:unnamed protein product [Arctogadus glacialis]
MDPKFRKNDGCISLFDSEDAKKVKAEKRPWTRALSPDEVKESAREAVKNKGRSDSPSNLINKTLLEKYISQFPAGRYAIRVKKDALSSKLPSRPATTASASTQAASTSQQPSASLQAPQASLVPVSSLRGLLSRRDQSPQAISQSVKRLFTTPKFQPSIPALPRAGSIEHHLQ